MRLVLVTFGSWGDINPFLSIAREAVSMGHEVALVTENWFLRRLHPSLSSLPIEFCGFDSGVDPDLPLHRPDVMDRWRGTGVFMKDVLEPALVPMFRAVQSVLRRSADVVICHHVCFSAAWAARTAGIPFVTAALAPASWMSLENPNQYPLMPDRDRYRRPLLVAGNAFGRMAMRLLIDPIANRARKQLGLPNLRDVMLEDMFRGIANIALWSPDFRTPASDDPPRSIICGFPFLDLPEDPDPELDLFLDADEPPILFTLGSLTGTIPSPFASIASESAQRLGVRAVIVIPAESSIPVDLPANIIVRPWADYAALMPRCRAVVHHAGMGTTAEMLRAQTPGVLIPFAHDQFDNARRSRLLGCSLTLDRKRLSADTLSGALQRVISDSSFEKSAAALGGKISQEHGARTVVETIADALGLPPKPDASPHARATTAAH